MRAEIESAGERESARARKREESENESRICRTNASFKLQLRDYCVAAYCETSIDGSDMIGIASSIRY